MTAARASFEALASLGKSLPSSPSGSSGDASKSKHSSLPLASSASPPPPPLQKTNSVSSLTKSGSNHSLTRTVSASSLSSHADTPTAEKRLSVTRADNVTVSFVGGKPQPRHGALRLKRSSLFASFRDSFVSVDNGEISFADNELEMNKRETYSLLEVREVKLVNPGSNQFALKLGSGGKGASKTVSLKCDTPKEAADWIAAIHHELRNQVLVCQQSVKTLQEAGHSDRCEPFFKQALDMIRVVTDGLDNGETADILISYATWLQAQSRPDEAATMKRQVKAIRRRIGEPSGHSNSDGESSEHEESLRSIRTPSPGHPPLPPRRASDA